MEDLVNGAHKINESEGIDQMLNVLLQAGFMCGPGEAVQPL